MLEVDTPLLSRYTVTDPHVHGIPAFFKQAGLPEQTLYLQTSPEYAMKRLLAAGAGSIFQICKAFRQGDLGRRHHPEFTMLEWYRTGFDHTDLMNEMDLLLQAVLKTPPADRFCYKTLFENHVGINPHTASVEALMQCVRDQGIEWVETDDCLSDAAERNRWLDLLLTHSIEPQMGLQKPVFIYDFPTSQSALARIRYEETPAVASRFEVYFKGLELANGFHELQDPAEQRRRFEADLLLRAEQNLPRVLIDDYFLAALEAGLPDCSGVALGVDRLVMAALDAKSIDEVVSFGFGRVARS